MSSANQIYASSLGRRTYFPAFVDKYTVNDKYMWTSLSY